MPAGRAGEASFGYDPLECQKCGCFMELVEIWEPQRGHVWMKRWLETHRVRKAARDALSARLTALLASRNWPSPSTTLPERPWISPYSPDQSAFLALTLFRLPDHRKVAVFRHHSNGLDATIRQKGTAPASHLCCVICITEMYKFLDMDEVRSALCHPNDGPNRPVIIISLK